LRNGIGRRRFLQLGAAAVAGLLADCGDGAAPRRVDAEAASGRGAAFDPIDTVAPGAWEELSVVSGSFEQLTDVQVRRGFQAL
jgi:hypothetical protein